MGSAEPGPIRVLHVDDDRDLADLVAIQLERVLDDVTVETETSASDGMNRLADGDPIDCVVSDLEMPGMDGLEFLRAVRDEYDDLPFVLYTGKGSEEVASEAISAGVTEYLQKGTGEEQYEVLAHRIERAVTERRAQAALEESERMFSTLVRNLPGVVYRCKMATGWPMDFVSDGCEELTGYEPEAIESDEVSWGRDVIHPDDRRAIWEAVESSIEAEESFTLTYRILTADDEARWVWEQGSPVYEGGELAFLEGFISDITARRRRRAELVEERAVTEHALDALDDGFHVVDHETGEFLRWNDRIPEFTGYDDGELAEMTVFDLVPDGYVSDLLESADRTLDGSENPLEIEVVRKDGERVPLEVRGAPIRNDDGELIGIGSIARDITERKRREERLEQFASVVSHDLRNPLHVIQGRVELARQTGDLDQLEHVVDAADQMDALIDDLLTLALKGETVGETAPVALTGLAREAWRTVETGRAALDLADSVTVEADRDRLRDVLANLFRNAVEHSDADTRSLTLEQAVERAAGAEGADRRDDESQPPVRVRVGSHPEGFYVEDDGPGIPPAERQAVFEYGYTTRDDGTGLGLSIVGSVAEAHGWTVSIGESEWGGARFEFST